MTVAACNNLLVFISAACELDNEHSSLYTRNHTSRLRKIEEEFRLIWRQNLSITDENRKAPAANLNTAYACTATSVALVYKCMD